MNSLDAPSVSLREIHHLINECHAALATDPSCLHTRAVRGHACMKIKLWDQAIQDFSEILRRRPDDVHGRFSRGMALFKSKRVDDAQRDFSQVLELNPSHVMARYARAGCYNSEGAFHEAIEEYLLALQHDEKENAGGFRGDKCRLGMHESAEQLIRKALRTSARLRATSDSTKSNISEDRTKDNKDGRSNQKLKAEPSEDIQVRSESVPGKRPRKVVQVRVNLSEFASTSPQQTSANSEPQQPPPQKATPFSGAVVVPVDCITASTSTKQPHSNSTTQQPTQQSTPATRVASVRVIPKAVRRVTVAL